MLPSTSNEAPWRVMRLSLVKRRRHYPNIVERSETVVLKIRQNC
jgi:hypothetical protein